MNDQLPTFDSLPQIVAEINRKLDILLTEYTPQKEQDKHDRLMTLEELREYLPEKPARQTVYDWILKGKIPKEKFPNSNRVFFRKSTIDIWLTNGRQI